MIKILDYISTFFIYFMMLLWAIICAFLFIIELLCLLPFVLIEESYKRLKNLFNKKEPLT
jgi:hypothetical protein